MTTLGPQVKMSSQCWQLWLDGSDDLIAVWDMQPSQVGQWQWHKQRNALATSWAFFGARSEPEARKILQDGWPEGARLVEKLAQLITDEMPPPKSRRRVRKWSDEGDECSFERVQLGYDNVWLSNHRKLKNAVGLVEIIAEWGESCGASVEQLKWSGASALALCDMLEKADYSCSLALVAAMTDNADSSNTQLVRVDLKRMGQVIDIEKLAAIAVYPAAWRLYGLCAFQQSCFSSGDNFNSHPHSTAFRHKPEGMWGSNPNVFTLKLHTCHSELQAKDQVLDALKQLDSFVNPQDAW